MKKLMFVAALAGAMTGLCDVSSANVVGYAVKDDISIFKDANNRSFTLLGLPFKNINSANGNWSLNDLQFSSLTAKLNKDQADQIWLWGDTGDGVYDYIPYFRKNATGWFSCKTTTRTFDQDYPDGLPAGTAFWFAAYNPNAAIQMTDSGEVGNADREITIMRGQFQFVSYPFPVNLKLNDTDQFDSSNCTTKLNKDQADQIWFWMDMGDGTWDYVPFFRKNATGWFSCKSTSTSFSTLYPNGVTVGSGFWFKSYGTGEDYKITFKTPVPAVSAE